MKAKPGSKPTHSATPAIPVAETPLVSKFKTPLIIAFTWAVIGGTFANSDLGKLIEFQNARRLEFVVRDTLNRSPDLDRKLRIFAFDDKAIAAANSPELLLTDYTNLLASLRERKPRAILIDKIFGYVSRMEEGGVGPFVAEIAQHSNLAVGSFLTPTVIPLRPPLDPMRPEFTIEETSVRSPSLNQWLPVRNLQTYGPQPAIASKVKIGQIVYPGQGAVYPWVRVSTSHAIPHLSLLAADQLRLTPEGPEVNGQIVPLDRQGLVKIDFNTLDRYYNATNSMRSLLERAKSGEPITDVNEGDTVLLLPLMFTGNTDFIDTPFGRIPGGFALASMINSVLTGQWLRPLGNPWVFLFLGVCLGGGLGLLSDPKWFWLSFVSVPTLLIGGGTLGFSFGGFVIPWFYPAVSFAGAALSMQSITAFKQREKSRRLNSALSGLVPKERLNRLLAGTVSITREPRESVVTAMFLDISNFSLTALRLQPKEVFYQLKSMMNRITEAVHRHGGTIDRTMGDGLLCFFGYSYEGHSQENHAQAAIACAREIQSTNAKHCIESAAKGEPVWPFRIGINTTTAFIGDLGNQERIDFTLIGSGVNLAQRLEAASDQHSIMVSLTTFDIVPASNGKKEGIHRCKIKVKNHKELVECVEIDPLVDSKDLRQQATKAFRDFLALERAEQRWPVISQTAIVFDSPHGEAELVDFSRSGFCISLPIYLARGVSVVFDLSSPISPIDQKLKMEKLQQVRTEVRWSRPKDGKYLHGFLFTDLNEARMDLL